MQNKEHFTFGGSDRGPIAWFARNTVAANLLMIGIFFAGIIGFTSMEREMSPTIQIPLIEVFVSWPGAAPQEIEEQIVSRIEESVSDLDNIDWIRSISRESNGRVVILANLDADIIQLMNDIKTRVESIPSFPRDMEPPNVAQRIQRNEFMRVALHGDLSERKLKRLAEKLRLEVANLEGVSLVQLFGTRREEIAIEVSEEALRRYGLSFTDVANAVRASSINLSSGSVRTNTGELNLSVRNQADTAEDFANIIIRQTPDGGVLRIGDVATVNDGFEDEEILATLNGEPSVLIQMMTTETMDVVTASNSVRAWLKEREKTLPAGAKLTLWNDNAVEFKGRMSTIGWSAFLGLLLVMAVLLLSLRPKVAVWVTIGIATAYAGAFILLPSLDISLNMLSTFAFLLVLGIVVDDAIVVGENIHTESHYQKKPIDAATIGTQMVAKPVVFAVLTTIIAFLPWVFLSGPVTEYTRQITWVVITALSFSLIESMFILPAHLSKMKPRKHLGRFSRFQKKIADGITNVAENRYRRIGQWSIRNRYITFAVFMGILFIGISGLFSNGYVKTGFQPEIESDEININVVMPDGAPYSRALEVLDQLQTAEIKLIDEYKKASDNEIEIVENWYTRSRRDSVIAIVKLAPPELRDNVSAKEIALRLRELIGEIPDAEEVSVNYKLDNNDPGLQFTINHPTDMDILMAATEDFKKQLRTYDSVIDVRDNLEAATQELRMSLLPGAEKLGFTLADVSRQVRNAYFGAESQRLARNGQDVKVMVRYPRSTRYNMESLKHFRLRTADGREVPLTSVVSLEFAPGINSIIHWDRKCAAIVSADLTEEVRDDIMEDLDENFFPEWKKRYPGIDNGAIGQAEGQKRFFKDLFGLYALALFAMYAMLAIGFKSYSQPILIMISIPFAFLGAVLGHFMMGEVMAIFSYFGIAAAAGVVINDNLVLVDYCNKLRAKGIGVYDAIVEAGVARFRPILLTTVTTIVGLVPMMLERSIQAAFLQPVVIALAFGVFIAFFVTLLLVPAMYAIGADIGAMTLRLKNRILGRPRDYNPNAPAGDETPAE